VSSLVSYQRKYLFCFILSIAWDFFTLKSKRPKQLTNSYGPQLYRQVMKLLAEEKPGKTNTDRDIPGIFSFSARSIPVCGGHKTFPQYRENSLPILPLTAWLPCQSSAWAKPRLLLATKTANQRPLLTGHVNGFFSLLFFLSWMGYGITKPHRYVTLNSRNIHNFQFLFIADVLYRWPRVIFMPNHRIVVGAESIFACEDYVIFLSRRCTGIQLPVQTDYSAKSR
jgi:hypothetical protein